VRFLAQSGVVVNSPSAANSNNDNIWVRDVDYVVIDGFESTAAPRAGIAVQGEPDANATGIVIRNCFCHDNSRWGIFTGFARDLLLENNETSFSAIEHGIYVSNSGDRPTVRGNHSHHNNASGIQLNADPSELFDPNDPIGDGIITGALLEFNVIHDNGAAGGAAINLASVRDSVFRNNLLYNNHSSAIAGWDDGDNPNYGTRDNRIIGNTIVQAANSRFAISLKNGSFNNVILNNILLNAGPRGSLDVDPSSRPGMQSDYNVVSNQFSDDDSFFTLAEWRSLFGFDQHSILSTSAAVFVGANDYHLSSNSPARDSGTTLPDLPSDLDGTARPQGAQFDIGAYELSGTGPSVTPTATAVPATATRTRTGTATRTRTATATASATAIASSTPTAGQPSASRIDGSVHYYRGDLPLAGADVALDGPGTQTTSSDALGHFEFSAVPDAAWQITPRKSGSQGNGVSALDASWVLQYIAGRRSFDTMQQLVCDVTANGSLTTLDATRILQHRRQPLGVHCRSVRFGLAVRTAAVERHDTDSTVDQRRSLSARRDHLSATHRRRHRSGLRGRGHWRLHRQLAGAGGGRAPHACAVDTRDPAAPSVGRASARRDDRARRCATAGDRGDARHRSDQAHARARQPRARRAAGTGAIERADPRQRCGRPRRPRPDRRRRPCRDPARLRPPRARRDAQPRRSDAHRARRVVATLSRSRNGCRPPSRPAAARRPRSAHRCR
jgi:hypothetical protein